MYGVCDCVEFACHVQAVELGWVSKVDGEDVTPALPDCVKYWQHDSEIATRHFVCVCHVEDLREFGDQRFAHMHMSRNACEAGCANVLRFSTQPKGKCETWQTEEANVCKRAFFLHSSVAKVGG